MSQFCEDAFERLVEQVKLLHGWFPRLGRRRVCGVVLVRGEAVEHFAVN